MPTAAAAAAVIDASSAMSISVGSSRPGCSAASAASSGEVAALREAAATFSVGKRRSSCCTSERPMPREAPVTKAVPLIFANTSLILYSCCKK